MVLEPILGSLNCEHLPMCTQYQDGQWGDTELNLRSMVWDLSMRISLRFYARKPKRLVHPWVVPQCVYSATARHPQLKYTSAHKKPGFQMVKAYFPTLS